MIYKNISSNHLELYFENRRQFKCMVRNNIFHRLLNCFQSHSLRQKLAQDCCYSVFVNATKRMKFLFKGFFCIFRSVHTCYENFVFCFAKNSQSFRSNSLEMFFVAPICKTSRTSCDLAIKLVVYSNFHYYNKIVLSVISVFFQNTGEKYRLKNFRINPKFCVPSFTA